MRPRLLIPATLVTAVLVTAALALPASSAYADDPAPSATPTTTATDTPSPTGTTAPVPTDTPSSPTGTPAPTTTPTPTSTPVATATPTSSGTPPVTVGAPTAGLPWADDLQVPYDTSSNDTAIFDVEVTDYGGAPGTITSVTATLTPVATQPGGDSGPTVLKLGAAGGLPSDDWWYSHFTLPSLGTYRASVEVTDQAGNDVVIGVGTFHYHDVMSFSQFTGDGPSQLSYDDHELGAHGVLTATDPRTGQTSPVAGATLQPTYNGVNSQGYPAPQSLGAVTTAADGTFTVPPYSAPTSGSMSVSYTPQGTDAVAYTSTSVGTDTYWTTQELTRVVVTSPSNANVPVGGSTAITGIIEREDNGSWLPAPGEQFELETGSYATDVYDGTADGTGHFSIPVNRAGSYNVNTEMTPYLYFDGSSYVTVHIPQPDSITGLSISEDAYGEAVISGNVYLGSANVSLGHGYVQVQYSSDDRNWHTVGSTAVGGSNAVNDTFSCYAVYGGRANGYWRVYFAGTPDWRAVYSKAVYLSREYTWISGGRPSSSHPGRNQREYFSGTLHQYYSGKWHNFPKAKVQLLFRPTGGKTWYLMATATTNGSGNYNISAQDPEGGTWMVTYLYADSAHLDTEGPSTWVGVH